MSEDYYSDCFKREHNYGESILIKPKTCCFIPARVNLRATIEAEGEIKTYKLWRFFKDRETPALFWDENLVSLKENTCIFETKYCQNSDDILPISYLNQVPERLRQDFLREVPERISSLANRLTGDEKDTKRILELFHIFVREHRKRESLTTGKPIEQLLDELEQHGYFFGNCKEARDFIMALCNAKGYPTKKVNGKSLDIGGHVWVDVFVPVRNDYKLFPIDSALGYFGCFDPFYHLFHENSPEILTKKKDIKDYRLKIEQFDSV